MRSYSVVSPQFWTGRTGKKLRSDPDAQRIAMYLITSPHAHQSGIYYIPMLYLSTEVGIPFEGASEALRRLIAMGFCEYDTETEWVWVCEMAAWQIGVGLSPNDKRAKGLQQYLLTLPGGLPFLGSFTERYGSDFHLEPPSGRAFEGASCDSESAAETPSKAPGRRGYEGAYSDQNRTEQNNKKAPDAKPEAASVPPEGLDSAAWQRWLEYRKQIRKPLKPPSIPAAQKALAAYGPAQAAVVEQSIAAGWQGLFALKPSAPSAHPETPSATSHLPIVRL